MSAASNSVSGVVLRLAGSYCAPLNVVPRSCGIGFWDVRRHGLGLLGAHLVLDVFTTRRELLKDKL